MTGIKELLSNEALFVFALAEETAGLFSDNRCLMTGVGKINAAYSLTRQIHLHRPNFIVNIGTAGSSTFKQGEIVCCTNFVQRDMDVTPLGFAKYETPFSNLPPVLSYGLQTHLFPCVTCGSGDTFEQAQNLANYEVVDMEAFSLAYVAIQEQIPFLCLKYISDGANEDAAKDWTVSVPVAARALKNAIATLQLQ